MQIASDRVFEILKEQGVTSLHHANSVATSCQFLKHGGLLSRGVAERRDLYQTKQYTDTVDRRYSLWYDVFLDSVDIHHRARDTNKYGPVLFVLNLNVLKEQYTGNIWVTKLNPTKWAGKKMSERWFQSDADLEKHFSYGSFDQMIVLRHLGGELPFEANLEKIILDDIGYNYMPDNISYYDMAYGALRVSMQEYTLNVPIEKRKCRGGCACDQYWKKNIMSIDNMFNPHP